MAETPVLTEYLLKLSTDADELKNFRAAQKGKTVVDYLAQQGLDSEQADAIESNDPHKIVKAVLEELRRLSALHKVDPKEKPLFGTPVTIVAPLGNFQQDHLHLTQ
ncbi:MAG TPA: hypothetical protein VFF63_08625 [Candidatus Babeliales bacterium]|nr:hypothetical protein [Candidatus Babeliales bacterium]